MDSALLLFDRDTGLNALCEGVETAELRQLAPRMVQFGITNNCNLACTFCSRDMIARSEWTSESAFEILSALSASGVLEVAFGGGEPWVFPDFTALVCRLYDETELAVNFTTNGLALTKEKISAIKGKYGQLRLSLYNDNDWRSRVSMLADEQARFGVNYLVTPERLLELETIVLELCDLGCNDILLLSYNGYDDSLHLNCQQAIDLARQVELLAKALRRRCQIKLGVCWGEHLDRIPRLFNRDDCGAGRDFVVLTSDKKLQPCSFHQVAIPVETAEDILNIWSHSRSEMSSPATIPGCARLDATNSEWYQIQGQATKS
jgi:MoaA/NifB/PqqE/SkfB family radical SAM enzyme